VKSIVTTLWRTAVLFLGGIAVFAIGGYWDWGPAAARNLVKVLLPAVLFLAFRGCQRRECLEAWSPACAGLLAASTAFLASWLISGRIIGLFGVTTQSLQGLALAKLFDVVPLVFAALVVARLSGFSWKDLYLCQGKTRAWLAIGSLAFVGFSAVFLVQARVSGIAAPALLSAAPWVLVFVLTNGFMEELHFRGLLLRPFEELLGRHPANLCVAAVFTLVHVPVGYVSDVFPFLTVLFVLAVVWGLLIQKTGSLWGAALFHAGADLVIMIDIIRAYGQS
jgi:membrane protease YdiL (CAAX protease family)